MQVTGNNIPSPHKSIRLSMDGLSFFWANAWKQIDFTPNDVQLEQAKARLLCEQALQNLQIANLEVNYPYVTLVPSQLLSKQDALSAFQFHFPAANSTPLIVASQEIPAFNITLLFGIPKVHYQLVTQLFDKVQWQHRLTYHLAECLKRSKQKGETQAWIWAEQTHLHICIASNGSLLFANYFPYTNQQDVLYYTAKVFEQHHLSQQQTPTYVVGNQKVYQLLVNHLAQCQHTEEHAHC